MRVWTVHVRPGRGPELVREGFSWGALLLGPLWLLACRAWIPAALLAAAWALVVALTRGGPLPLVLVALAGLLGNDARRWSLSLAGAPPSGVVAAPDEQAAFVRLLAARPDLMQDEAGLRA